MAIQCSFSCRWRPASKDMFGYQSSCQCLQNWLTRKSLEHKEQTIKHRLYRIAYLRSDVAVCVAHAKAKTPLPPIPFEGFIQSSKNSLGNDWLNAWFNAKWTPVRGKLTQCIANQDKFCERNEAYEYSLVHGKPAVGKGGRPLKVNSQSHHSHGTISFDLSVDLFLCNLSILQRLTSVPRPGGSSARHRRRTRGNINVYHKYNNIG